MDSLKILLIGDSGTGKSSILLRFIEDKFLGEDVHEATIGVDFKAKTMMVNDKPVKLTIWDTAGQERFRTLTSSYYRGAQGVILVYDVSDPKTFSNLDSWFKEMDTFCANTQFVKMIVGNKIDKQRQISREKGLEFAKLRSSLYAECSAKNKTGITQAFEEMVTKILEISVVTAKKTEPVKITLNEDEETSCLC